MTKDEEHLRLLSIFHFVVAGVTALFALFPIIHMLVGLAIVSGVLQPADGDEIPAAFGWFFVLFAGVWIVLGLAVAVAIALGGRALRRRRHYTFCLVVAGVTCLLMPFGTVLGVFTIVVLMRDSVREMFDGQSGKLTT
ncbi:MAG: hypothetical protein GY716_13910 [bacterium]|nr:hypothetical protein [bacterium]